MTNEEAIKQLKERYDIGQKEYLNFSPRYIESLKMAMESLQENTKLKAEIDRLNGKSEMYRDMADSFCNSNIKLKAEIEQLKSTVSKTEITTAQEDDLK